MPPAAARTEYVELQHGSTVLLLGSKAISCRNFSDLYRIGPSRGENFTAAGVAGTVAKKRLRDELGVELADIQINGKYNDDGEVNANPKANAKALLRSVTTFLETAPNRQMTVRLVDGDDTYEAACQFGDMGRIEWFGSGYQFSLLLIVNDGLLTKVVAP